MNGLGWVLHVAVFMAVAYAVEAPFLVEFIGAFLAGAAVNLGTRKLAESLPGGR